MRTLIIFYLETNEGPIIGARVLKGANTEIRFTGENAVTETLQMV